MNNELIRQKNLGFTQKVNLTNSYLWSNNSPNLSEQASPINWHSFTKSYASRVIRRLEKIAKILKKSSQNSCQVKKCQNIYTKAQFENPEHLHQTTFITLKRP